MSCPADQSNANEKPMPKKPRDNPRQVVLSATNSKRNALQEYRFPRSSFALNWDQHSHQAFAPIQRYAREIWTPASHVLNVNRSETENWSSNSTQDKQGNCSRQCCKFQLGTLIPVFCLFFSGRGCWTTAGWRWYNRWLCPWRPYKLELSL
jgi:hypothetical protein